MDKSLEMLNNGAAHFQLEFNTQQKEQFLLYKDLLLTWNEKINLTAITDIDEIMIKHFIDSLTICKFLNIKPPASVIDVGTGAGFPGIPLKIWDPELHLVLLDSLNKRINFLKEVTDKLFLSSVEFIHGRAEDFGRNKKYREKFDYVVSRAVAKLSVLAEYCLPFVKVGGFFIAYKGPNIDDEVSLASKSINELGGKIKEVNDIKLPYFEGSRKLIIIEKIIATPAKYPRKAGTPEKHPI